MEENPDMDFDAAVAKTDALVVHGDQINKAIEQEIALNLPEDVILK
jgi:hypothetical protein